MRRVYAGAALTIGFALASFFSYYTIRLAVVWATRVAPGKAVGGMYIGAIVFPALVVAGAMLALKGWRGVRARRGGW